MGERFTEVGLAVRRASDVSCCRVRGSQQVPMLAHASLVSSWLADARLGPHQHTYTSGKSEYTSTGPGRRIIWRTRISLGRQATKIEETEEREEGELDGGEVEHAGDVHVRGERAAGQLAGLHEAERDPLDQLVGAERHDAHVEEDACGRREWRAHKDEGGRSADVEGQGGREMRTKQQGRLGPCHSS